jgi:hypothetical protein
MKKNIQNRTRNIFRVFVCGFALVGFIFVFVFFAMRFGWLNVKGSISERNSYFNLKKNFGREVLAADNLTISCQISVLGTYAPLTAINIYRTLSRGTDEALLSRMITVASKRFENDLSYHKAMNRCETNGSQALILPMSAYNWADTDQWNLMKEVFIRDQEIIKKAAADARISPRLILSGVIGEQFRFFNNRRESFKSYFEPLKILASLSNTSFGIAGLKPKTVSQIESHLKDRNSSFYLGSEMEHVADYGHVYDVESERLSRITDAKNPYYSYLYIGLFMKQIQTQWQKAGYDIDTRPEILATLYNLGFYYSTPKPDPEAGGTMIEINGASYTFGDIAYEFYYSGELSDIFPLGV